MQADTKARKYSRIIWDNLFLITKNYFHNLSAVSSSKTENNFSFEAVFLFGLFPILFPIILVVDIFSILFVPGLHLFRPLFKAGWKYALISAIGVTLAVSIITQYVFFIYSYQYKAFDLFLEEEPRTYIQVKAESTTIYTDFPLFHYFDRVAQLAIEDMNLTENFLQHDIFFKRGTFTTDYDPLTQVSSLPNAPLIGTEGKLRDFIYTHIANGTVPSLLNETLVLMTSDYYEHSSIRVNSTLKLYIPVSLSKESSFSDPGAQTTIKVTGIVFLDQIPEYHITGTDRTIPLETILELEGNLAFISDWYASANILDNIAKTYNLADLSDDLFYDISKIDSFKLEKEISQIKQISLKLKEWYSRLSNYQNIDINSFLVDLLEQFRDEYNLYQIFMFSFLVPIIALTTILTSYASNLVKKKRERQLTILTERGTSRAEMGFYLVLESLIMGIVALVMGIIIGIPFAGLLTRSSGFLTFGNTAIQLQIQTTSIVVSLIGSIIAILSIQILNIILLTKKRSVEDYGHVEKSLPHLYRYWIDVILIGFGVLMWIVYRIPALSSYKNLTSKYIGIPATFFMLFGLTLFLQRLFPLFAKWLAVLGHFLRKDLFVLGMKELHRYQKTFVQSSIILTLSFSIVFSSLVVPTTYQDFNITGAYYDVGADISVRNFPVDNNYLLSKLENVSNIDSITYVKLVNLIDVSGDISISYSVLALDPESFVKTAYFRKDFASTDLISLLNHLNSSTDVLVQRDELKAMNQQIGQQLTLTYRAYNETNRQLTGSPFFNDNLTVNIVADFFYWPVLLQEISTSNARSINYHFVTKLDFFNNIQIAPFDLMTYLYIKVKDTTKVLETAQELKQIIGSEVKAAESQVFLKIGSARSSILYASINSTLIMAFAINTIILALFASVQLIDKSRELATMKAIGISLRQMIVFYLSIYIGLVVYSVLAGIISGVITSNMLMGVLSITRSIPPYFMIYPIGLIATVIA
ncbi:MAG: FtsX-like permease family protein, partial [Candidatus Heimdallarchaeaceae archaeon]